ncbi:lytic transglycosylase domain-containing protein [Paenibacillus antri]|uniref:Lytic transglycosylase domain-containing protein n=2 Tax=Paenibacillus antri TaxID=2582848 RepID=A0A5R9GCG4_9BACL|nr:lytic transglycosylase domain-containing protein [Paenibacillus antri]
MEQTGEIFYNEDNQSKNRSDNVPMSINSVDPKLITAWLKTQFLSTTEITSASLGGSEVGSGSSPNFAALLQLLTAQAGNGTLADEAYERSATFGLDGLVGAMPLKLAGLSGTTYEAAAPAPGDIDGIIQEASAKYGVDPALVRAVVRVESGFDPTAESHAGAKGLMQLMDATARSLGVSDSFDPVQNVNGGTRFLSYLLTKYNGNEGVALAAYNAGPGRVDRLGIRTDADLATAMNRLPKETQAYVGKVLGARG